MHKSNITGQNNSKIRFFPLGVFLVFVLSVTFIFFACVYRDIEQNARNSLMNTIEHQTQNFQNIINQNFQYMEGVAQYIGAQDDLTGSRNLALLESLSEKSSVNGIGVVTPEGMGYYPNGDSRYVGDAEFFQEAMAGSRAMSKPVESVIDGQLCIVLTVPIFRGDEVVGVLDGSCNLSALGHMLLNDTYSGSSFAMIVDTEGDIISYDAEEISDFIASDSNFFSQLESAAFPKTKPLSGIRDDFAKQRSSMASFSYQKEPYYIGYMPLGIENWMFCYIMPRAVACSPYSFITTYGIALCTALIIGTSVLLLAVLYVNSRVQKELLKMGQSDSLTGMLNKQSTENMIQHWLDCEQKVGVQAFVMMDIDHFKMVNDTYGHAAGDTILREISQLIRLGFREGDITGRIGGDEFCILMKDVASEANAVAKIERLSADIRRHSFKNLEGISVTCSIGLSFAPQHGKSFAELYHTADLALYETKRNGRNGYSVYTEDPRANR